jgi:hypothetical protein
VPPQDLDSFTKRVGGSIEAGSHNRTWWIVKDGKYTGWQQSISSILHVLTTQGPFHGVLGISQYFHLGYSQGATVVSLLLGILDRSFPEFAGDLPKLEFAILVAGFKSRDPDHSMYYSKETKASTPSLVVIGDSDEMVPAAGSLAMAEYFQSPQIYRHLGGHMIPMKTESIRTFREFIVEEYPKM